MPQCNPGAFRSSSHDIFPARTKTVFRKKKQFATLCGQSSGWLRFDDSKVDFGFLENVFFQTGFEKYVFQKISRAPFLSSWIFTYPPLTQPRGLCLPFPTQPSGLCLPFPDPSSWSLPDTRILPVSLSSRNGLYAWKLLIVSFLSLLDVSANRCR